MLINVIYYITYVKPDLYTYLITDCKKLKLNEIFVSFKKIIKCFEIRTLLKKTISFIHNTYNGVGKKGNKLLFTLDSVE